MKVRKALNILLGVQILMWLWFQQIGYTSSHDGKSDFSGLAALIPQFIFILLSLVNLILLAIYVFKARRTGTKLSALTFVLVFLVVGLAATMGMTSEWLEKLGGNDYLPNNDFDFYN